MASNFYLSSVVGLDPMGRPNTDPTHYALRADNYDEARALVRGRFLKDNPGYDDVLEITTRVTKEYYEYSVKEHTYLTEDGEVTGAAFDEIPNPTHFHDGHNDFIRASEAETYPRVTYYTTDGGTGVGHYIEGAVYHSAGNGFYVAVENVKEFDNDDGEGYKRKVREMFGDRYASY